MAEVVETAARYVHTNVAIIIGPKAFGPSLRQPTFDLIAKGNYTEFRNFEMEVNNIFLTYSYNISNAEKVLIIKKG